MKLIVAVDEKWGIGRNGDLLLSIPDDMLYYRATTRGKVVVMGYTTLLSLPQFLHTYSAFLLLLKATE